MKSISMLDLRSSGRAVVQRLACGETMALTYRGKRVATLVPESPAKEGPVPKNDPIFRFAGAAEPMGGMTNEEIDELLYGQSTNLR